MTPLASALVLAALLAGAVLGVAVARLLARSERANAERAERQLRETFQSLAAEALHTNRSAFLDLARTSFSGFQREAVLDLESRQRAIDGLVQPMLTTLKGVDQKLTEAEKERSTAYAQLTERMKALGESTTTLSRALRTPDVRGRWGEMQLRRVVEIAGMLEHCDFEEQPTIEGGNGRLRPDLIVSLPGGKQIVVDAKAPLDAYLDAQSAADDAARVARLTTHARQVRDHVDRLGSKAYWDQLGHSPEMVVLFLPGEALFAAALQHDLTLVEAGLQQKVLLASPITLIALLTTVAHSWRQEALADNYREIATLGKEFYERLTTFSEHFDDLRRKLDGAVQSYNKAVGSFEGRVLVSARRLRELSVTTREDIPPAEAIDTVPRALQHGSLAAVVEESPSVGDHGDGLA